MKFKTGLVVLSSLFLTLSSFPVSSNADFRDGTDEGFIFMGDQGKDNDGQLEVSRSMVDFCAVEKCDYGIGGGDNVYHAGLKSASDRGLEEKFDKYYNQLNIPFFMTLGNHDYGKYSFDWKRGTFQLMHARKNPLFVMPYYWYIKETENAVIAVLDTTRLMWRKDTFIQADMLAEAHALAKKKNKWYFVLGHHPYLSNGQHGNAGNYERLKWPYFASGSNVKKFIERHVCGKADFYLAGHEHLMQVFDGNQAGCDSQLIVSGTAASASKLFKRNRPDLAVSQEGYFHLSVKPEAVRLRAVDVNAKVFFEKTYQR